MPPLFTSTTITTLLRKVVHAARHARVQALPSSVASGSSTATVPIKQWSIPQIRAALRRLALQTFPSLSTPASSLNFALQPIRLGQSSFTSHPAVQSIANPIGRANAFRMGGYRHVSLAPRGASINSHLGLGTARNFSSGPTTSLPNNVPVVLRTFFTLLSDEDVDRGLPRANRYRPYKAPSNRRKLRTASRLRTFSHSSNSSALVKELEHFFPLRRRNEIPITLPPTPETLITIGTTTTLALPLSPSLHALLSPTPTVPYREAEIGISILARLTHGLLPLHDAFDIYGGTRIIPLLAKLESLGVIDTSETRQVAKTEMDVVLDSEGRPDILRIIFHDRSITDIKVLLGESLREKEKDEWWALSQSKEKPPQAVPLLDMAESKAIMEQWDPKPLRELHPQPPSQPTTPKFESEVELVFPTIDLETSLIHTPEEQYSWPSSRSTTPLSLPAVDEVELELDSGFSSSPLSPPEPQSGNPTSLSLSRPINFSLTEAVLAQLESEDPASTSNWSVSVTPTESDLEVESVISADLSDIWSAGSVSGYGYGSRMSESVSVLDVEEIEESQASLWEDGDGASEGTDQGGDLQRSETEIWAGPNGTFGLVQPW